MFDGDFYGEELHLVVVGYIRPENGEKPLKTSLPKNNNRHRKQLMNTNGQQGC
nr:hypothetical protein [Tanacetum cinerariifolium]